MTKDTAMHNSVSPIPSIVSAASVSSTIIIIAAIVPAVIALVIVGLFVMCITALMIRKHSKTKPVLPMVVAVYQKEPENSYVNMSIDQMSVHDEPVVSTTLLTNLSDSVHDPTYMEARSEYLPTDQEPVYADLHHSTNPPAPPLPDEPVQYATVQQQTESKVSGEPVYADLHHSANPPAPPPAGEPVQYATVKKRTGSPLSEGNADLHLSSNPSAPPLPVQLVPDTVRKKTDVTSQSEETESLEKRSHTDCHCSTNPQAPPDAEPDNNTKRKIDNTSMLSEDKDIESHQGSIIISTVSPHLLPTLSKSKKQEPVYADLHRSSNPPAPPLPVEPVQYATVKKQTATVSGELVYTDLQHSPNPPAPPPAAEPVPVQYAVNTNLQLSSMSSTVLSQPEQNQPQVRVDSTSGCYSESDDISISMMPTESTESAGPGQTVFLEPPARNPLFAHANLPSEDNDSCAVLYYNPQPSLDCQDTNKDKNTPVVPDRAVKSDIHVVAETRGGGGITNEDSYMYHHGTVQHFPFIYQEAPPSEDTSFREEESLQCIQPMAHFPTSMLARNIDSDSLIVDEPDPPGSPLPVQPVQYATVSEHTNNTVTKHSTEDTAICTQESHADTELVLVNCVRVSMHKTDWSLPLSESSVFIQRQSISSDEFTPPSSANEHTMLTQTVSSLMSEEQIVSSVIKPIDKMNEEMRTEMKLAVNCRLHDYHTSNLFWCFEEQVSVSHVVHVEEIVSNLTFYLLNFFLSIMCGLAVDAITWLECFQVNTIECTIVVRYAMNSLIEALLDAMVYSAAAVNLIDVCPFFSTISTVVFLTSTLVLLEVVVILPIYDWDSRNFHRMNLLSELPSYRDWPQYC